jgi:23S rRNA (uridine2552-2'-O)-methyltransferase
MYKSPDHYSQRAKKEGYPARSVYKLQEIDEKYKLIRPGMRILDIGATPGSWSLYCLRQMKDSGSVIGIDPVLPNQGELSVSSLFSFVQGDICDQSTIDKILNAGLFDLVLSDAAPATTGNKLVDSSRSTKIAQCVIRIAARGLREGGAAVIKVFQGGDEQTLSAEMGKSFAAVKRLKPKASRTESFEVFLVGLKKKAAEDTE